MSVRAAFRSALPLGALLLAACDAKERDVPAGPQPRIEVDAPTVELGRLFRGEVCAHTFTIRNAGEARLHLGEVRKDCVCTVPRLSAQEVGPGATATVDCELHARLNPGKYEKKITLTSDDPRTPALTLQFRFEVAELYRVEPALVDFGSPMPGEKVTKECRVRILEGARLLITSVEESAGPVTASWEIDPSDATSATVRVSLDGTAPVGNLTSTVTLVTDHPRQPKIPVQVTARIVSPLSIEPASALNLGEFPRARGATGTVVLRNADRTHPLRVESAAVSVDGFERARAEVETVEEGVEYRVVVTISPDFPAKLLFGQIEIRTNLAVAPLQKLTLFGTAKDS